MRRVQRAHGLLLLRLFAGALALGLWSGPPAAFALDVPPLRARVNDLAGLLDSGARESLEAKLAAYEEQSGHQFVLLTLPSLQGDSLEEFSIRVAERWKIGQAKSDNGLIMIVAAQERRVRIEVGYGLEGVVPDAIAARVVRDLIVPAFKQGRYAQGIDQGFGALMQAAAGEKVTLPKRRSEAGWPWYVDLLVMVLFFFSFVGFAMRARGGRRRGLFLFGPPFGGGGFGGGGFGGFGGGGFGGGGFGGGGGGFGGGGASGNW